MQHSTSDPSRRSRAINLAKPGAAVLAALAVGASVAWVSAASGRSPGATAASSPPATVAATQIPASPSPPFLKPGTVIGASELGRREFVNSNDGFSVTTGQKLQANYPVTTINGGRTWRIDGPELHVAAANASDVVTLWGMDSTKTYYVYAGPSGAYTVDVTANGGKAWWRAIFGSVYAVVPFRAGAKDLLAFTNWPGVYYTTDGGQVWRYSKNVSTIP